MLVRNHYLTEQHQRVDSRLAQLVDELIPLYKQVLSNNVADWLSKLYLKLDIALPSSIKIESETAWQEFLVLKALARFPTGALAMAVATSYFVHKFILGVFAQDLLLKCCLHHEKQPIFSLALSEKQSGSNLNTIKTTATQHNGGFIVNGNKTYISNASYADYLCVLAKTTNNGNLEDFTLLLIPSTSQGIEVSLLSTLGNRGVLGEINLSNVFVKSDQVIAKPGLGLIILLNTLKYERLLIAYRAIEHAWVCYQSILGYAKNRLVQGGKLSQAALFQHQMTEYWMALTATSNLVYDSLQGAFTKKISAAKLDGIAAECKYAATNCFIELSDYYMQVTGATGFQVNALPANAFADALALSLAGGSNEVLMDIIGNALGSIND